MESRTVEQDLINELRLAADQLEQGTLGVAEILERLQAIQEDY